MRIPLLLLAGLVLLCSLSIADDSWFPPTGKFATETVFPVTGKFAPKSKEEPKKMVRTDLHTHVCRNCGTAWSHGPENNGKLEPHKCPTCGTVEWGQSPSFNLTPQAPSLPVFKVFSSQSNCPGGVCPTSRRRR